MSAGDLLDAARRVAALPDRRLGSTRFTGAALLARQALEEGLDDLWADVAPGLERCSARAQLISLPYYLDEAVAGDVRYAWNRLSVAAHHGAYELPPTATELAGLIEVVERFLLAHGA